MLTGGSAEEEQKWQEQQLLNLPSHVRDLVIQGMI
jgi:hypothetical protein